MLSPVINFQLKQTFHKLNAFPMKGKILLKKKKQAGTPQGSGCAIWINTPSVYKDLQPKMKDSV